MIQCPKCKKLELNGKYINSLREHVIPGLRYRLCPECRQYINRIQAICV